MLCLKPSVDEWHVIKLFQKFNYIIRINGLCYKKNEHSNSSQHDTMEIVNIL
jgi:hypothetical protein